MRNNSTRPTQPGSTQYGAQRSAAWSLALCLFLGGCAGTRLYSEARDQQGRAAKKAWAEVDLKSVIETERMTLANLLKAEQDTQGRVAVAIRDNRLRAFANREGGFRAALADAVDGQLVELVGSADAIHQHRKKLDEEAAASAVLAANAVPLTVTGLAPPACAELLKEPVPANFSQWLSGATSNFQRVAVRSSLRAMREECVKLTAKVAEFALAGAWGEAKKLRDQDEQALKTRRDASAAKREAFDKAVQAHEAALRLAVASPDRAAKVLEAAENLSKAHDALVALGDVFAIEALSEQRLKSLDEFASAISAAGTDKPLPESASKELKVAILLPRLFDEAKKALAEAKRPLALPLLLRRTHEELNVEAARRDIAASEAMGRLVQAQMDAIVQQAEALTLARGELALVDKAGDKCPTQTAMGEAFSRCDSKSRQLLYSATARYLDAIGRLDAQRYRLVYARLAAEHERSLSLSEVSTRQWESLIGTMVGQIAEYSAGGFEAKDFGPLIDWAALFYIGRGVNK